MLCFVSGPSRRDEASISFRHFLQPQSDVVPTRHRTQRGKKGATQTIDSWCSRHGALAQKSWLKIPASSKSKLNSDHGLLWENFFCTSLDIGVTESILLLNIVLINKIYRKHWPRWRDSWITRLRSRPSGSRSYCRGGPRTTSSKSEFSIRLSSDSGTAPLLQFF